jgi:hypothetical protein
MQTQPARDCFDHFVTTNSDLWSRMKNQKHVLAGDTAEERCFDTTAWFLEQTADAHWQEASINSTTSQSRFFFCLRVFVTVLFRHAPPESRLPRHLSLSLSLLGPFNSELDRSNSRNMRSSNDTDMFHVIALFLHQHPAKVHPRRWCSSRVTMRPLE